MQIKTVPISTILYRVEEKNKPLNKLQYAWFWSDDESALSYLFIYKHEFMGIPIDDLNIKVYTTNKDIDVVYMDHNFRSIDYTNFLQRQFKDLNIPSFTDDIGMTNNENRAKWIFENKQLLIASNIPCDTVETYGSFDEFGKWSNDIQNMKEYMLYNPDEKVDFLNDY